MNPLHDAVTAVSCPGKVLLAGGYLVLDRSHYGLVLSTPSRFYTVVRDRPLVRTPNPTTTIDDASFTITVDSPQFVGARWRYRVEKREQDSEWIVEPDSSNSSSNPFVHLSLASTISLAATLFPSSAATLARSDLHLTIVGANDFYSQDRNDTPPKPFAHLGCRISEVHKTGLGSSAAMTTSLVAALLLHFDSRSTLSNSTTPASDSTAPEFISTLSTSPVPPTKFAAPLAARAGRRIDQGTLVLIHNLAQYVHSGAQGKVGSGFDVSAAVWGSQVYRRFTVECLGEALGAKNREDQPSAKSLLTLLSPLYNPLWTSARSAPNVSPFGLPPRLTLLLADVDAGSHTPSMVGKVLAWKKADPEQATRIWTALHEVNGGLAETLGKLTRGASENSKFYEEQVEKFAKLKSDEWNLSSGFRIAAQQIQSTRSLMREMGERSSVPIEPPEQTRLLDAVSALPGVVGAGVPGAGGYDAIWVLALSPASGPSPLEQVDSVLVSWKEMSVRPLSRAAWVVGGQAEEVEASGLRRERVEEVKGLQEVVLCG